MPDDVSTKIMEMLKTEGVVVPENRFSVIKSRIEGILQSDSEINLTTRRASGGSNTSNATHTPSNQSAATEFSADSPAGYAIARSEKEIFFSYQATDEGIIILSNREQRPSTGLLGGSQGDHITAYIALLEVINSSIHSGNVADSLDMLVEAVQYFMDTKGKEQYKELERKKENCKEAVVPRDFRKRLTSTVNEVSKDESEIQNMRDSILKRRLLSLQKHSANVEQLKAAIKRSDNVIYAQFMADTAAEVLSDFQKLPIARLPKLGHSNPNEGNIVKHAIRELRLVNTILACKERYKLDNDEEQNAITLECIDCCKSIIKASNPQIKDDSTINENLVNCVRDCFIIQIDRNEVSEIISQILRTNIDINTKHISKLFNDLFDFKCAMIREAKEDEQDSSICIDENGNKKLVLENPIEMLRQVTRRHLDFMFVAFSQIGKIEEEEKIINNFITYVCDEKQNGQGWGKYTGENIEQILQQYLLDNRSKNKHNRGIL